MITNPKQVTWVNPTQATDVNGLVPWDAATDFAGIQISFDGVAAVSIPEAFAITEFDLVTLDSYLALKAGSHTLSLGVVTKEGTAGKLSDPVTFLREVVPVAPTVVVLA